MKTCLIQNLVPLEVITVAEWHRQGVFASEAEARGAYRLAWLQFLDGIGRTPEEWMGMTRHELDEWHRDDTVPKTEHREGA